MLYAHFETYDRNGHVLAFANVSAPSEAEILAKFAEWRYEQRAPDVVRVSLDLALHWGDRP